MFLPILFTLLTPEETFISCHSTFKGSHSADDNVSDCRCMSDCRYRGREFDLGLVPYFSEDLILK